MKKKVQTFDKNSSGSLIFDKFNDIKKTFDVLSKSNPPH